MREFLKGLELDDETIDSIMAEHGKLVTKDKEKITDLQNKLSTLKENSTENNNWKEKYDELNAKVEKEEQDKKLKEEDTILTNNINSVLKDKQFVNEYTKNSIINEIKTALKDNANMGKSAKDLFEEITKDKTDIFVNPNAQIDMPDVKDIETGNVSKEDFDKMGYKERVAFKQENPELFKKFNE